MATPSLAQQLQLAAQLHQTGRWAEAEKLYRQILVIEPDHGQALHCLGMLSIQVGRAEEACVLLRRAVATQPRSSIVWSDLAMALNAWRQFEEGAAAAQWAIQYDPKLVAAHFNLGIALAELKQTEKAIAACTMALSLNPKLAIIHSTLSALLRERGRLDQAEMAARNAIAIEANYAGAYLNLGVALADMRRLDEAIIATQRAIELQPSFVDAHFNLGNFLKDQHRLGEAVDAYRRAIELQPEGSSQARNNLAGALRDLGRLDESMETYRQAIAQSPLDHRPYTGLVFTLQFSTGCDAVQQLAECQEWNRRYAEPLRSDIQDHDNDRDPDPDRRLRIGYVSPDFRGHCQSFFTIPLLSHHDHDRFEIFCYGDVRHPDAVTERIRGYSDVWRSTVGLTDEQLAERVRADRIDILIDLTMQMSDGRLLVFARKPAPVQVAWLAYPGTTGLSTIDYRLTDSYLDPPGVGDENYSEKSIRLPDTFWCYDPLSELPVNELPALTGTGITFGCLNNFCKVNQEVMQLWGKVLKEVPDSRLLLMCPKDARQQTLETFQRQGLSADRLEFVSFQPREKYLQTYQRIDIVLDTFPYNGHTTSLDALWMGVPVVTLVGTTVVGRAGLSQMSNLGLTELVAHQPENFVRIARDLALDRDRLSELRRGLRQRMMQSPLMDGRRFARNIESAYRMMWKTWCAPA
jgi:protein O-GlcNAc transferase